MYCLRFGVNVNLFFNLVHVLQVKQAHQLCCCSWTGNSLQVILDLEEVKNLCHAADRIFSHPVG